ncbi:hypothetical protein TNCV_4633991 [Trichonephila clavipes]|nr:hypothetical protein TNCV_4633991 [Trichonephila clavipes]
MSLVSCSFEHHTSDRTIWFGSTPILRENTLEDAQGSPNSLPLPPISQEESKLDEYLDCPMTHRHYTFTNIHAFSGIQTQALQHSSQYHSPLYQIGSFYHSIYK